MPVTRSQMKRKHKGNSASMGTIAARKFGNSVENQMRSGKKAQSKSSSSPAANKPAENEDKKVNRGPLDPIFSYIVKICSGGDINFTDFARTYLESYYPVFTVLVTLVIASIVTVWKWSTFDVTTIGHARALHELNLKFSHKTYQRTSEVKSVIEHLDRLRLENPATEVHVVISGGPGSGKSELARQIGEAIYKRDNFYWISGRNIDLSFALYPSDVVTLEASSVHHLQYSLEEVLGKLNGKKKSEIIHSETKDEEVFVKFRQLREAFIDRSSRPVIIFDNVQKAMFSFLYKKHDYNKFLLHPGNDQYGEIRIIVTTQNRPLAKFQYVSYFSLFEGMPLNDCVNLLNTITNIHNDDKNASYLAKELGKLPLSLAQAAFYIQLEVGYNNEYSYYSYLKEFKLDIEKYRRNVGDMLEHLVHEGMTYNMTAIATSIKSIDQLVKTTDQHFYTDVACFIGYCDSRTISAKLLWQFIRMNPTLRDYTEFSVNNLVHKSSIFELRLVNISSTTGKKSLILTHQVTREASRIVCNMKSSKGNNVSQHYAVEDYLSRIVRVIFTGLLAEPEPSLNQIVEYTALDFKVVDVLMSLVKTIYNQRMDLSKVVTKEFCWAFLDSMAEAYLYWPNKHKSTVIMPEVDFLANMTEDSFSEKKPELAVLLSVLYLHNTGNQDPVNLKKIATLVESFGRSSFTNVDRISITKTVLLLNMIGTVYRGVGQNLSKAEELHDLALNISKRYGSRSEIAVSMHLLGIIHRYMKHFDTALKYHEEAVELGKNLYSDKNPRLGAFLLNSAIVYNRLGEFERANAIYREALSITKEAFGPRDQRVARVLNTLATNFYSLGKYDESVGALTEALSIHEEIHGDVHPHVAETLYFLGFTYRAKGDLHNSLKNLERSLAIREQYYGLHHYQVAEILHDLSNTQRELHHLDDAINNANRCLEIFRRFFGENSSEVAVSLNGIGLIYLQLGNARTAKVTHENALKIFENLNTKGSQAISISETLMNIGMAHRQLEQVQKAKEYYSRSLTICMTLYDENHPRVLRVLRLLKELESS